MDTKRPVPIGASVQSEEDCDDENSGLITGAAPIPVEASSACSVVAVARAVSLVCLGFVIGAVVFNYVVPLRDAARASAATALGVSASSSVATAANQLDSKMSSSVAAIQPPSLQTILSTTTDPVSLGSQASSVTGVSTQLDTPASAPYVTSATTSSAAKPGSLSSQAPSSTSPSVTTDPGLLTSAAPLAKKIVSSQVASSTTADARPLRIPSKLPSGATTSQSAFASPPSVSAENRTSFSNVTQPVRQLSCHVEKWVAISKRIGRAPPSFEEAIKVPIEPTDGPCYTDFTGPGPRGRPRKNWADSAQCCCAFWPPPDPDQVTPISRHMMLSDAAPVYNASAHGCVASFPDYAFSPPPHSFDSNGKPILRRENGTLECADVAMAVSGSLKGGLLSLQRSLSNIEKHFVKPLRALNLSVHVFYHVRTFDKVPKPPELPEWMKGYVLEWKDVDGLVNDAINHCTNNMVQAMFGEMTRRYEGRWLDGARGSFQFMHRHIFVAYRMVYAHAHAGGCKYRYVIRTRPDLAFPVLPKWAQVVSRLEDVPLLTASKLFIARSKGASTPNRCLIDDLLAIGDMESMGGYSTLIPDFKDLVRFVTYSRPDLNGHTNERMLAHQLHYRNVTFAEFQANYKWRAV